MSLVTTIGSKLTTSFVTITEADDILDLMPDDDADWTALSDNEKELRLKWAATLMSYLPWRGTRQYRNQRLCWPRTGTIADADTIPDEIKDAQAMLAYQVIHRALSNRPDIDSETDDPDLKSISISGLVSLTYADGRMPKGIPFLQIIRTIHFPIVLTLEPYLTRFRGGKVGMNPDTWTTTTTTSTTSTTTT